MKVQDLVMDKEDLQDLDMLLTNTKFTPEDKEIVRAFMKKFVDKDYKDICWTCPTQVSYLIKNRIPSWYKHNLEQINEWRKHYNKSENT